MKRTELSQCPGCGLELARGDGTHGEDGASLECVRLKDELSFYTLGLRQPFFIHQVLVDAYAAQHPVADAPPIRTAFALIGLFLLIERGLTGRLVQEAHVALARVSKDWPVFSRPTSTGVRTVADPLRAAPGEARDAKILEWARSVWATWAPMHERVRVLVNERFTQRERKRSERT